MSSHQLCVLCGVAPSGGCSSLSCEVTFDDDTRKIADEIDPNSEETRQIIRDMLRATFSDEPGADAVGFPYTWWPAGMGYERYNEMLHVAIGYFDADGVCERRDGFVPSGRGVEVRRVDGYMGDAEFAQVVRVVDGEEERIDAWSACTASDNNPNFMLCEPCLFYLEAWVATEGLPPRSCAFPLDPELLSFAEELYEIINSQEKPRVDGVGILPAIDYDGIENTLDECQDCFLDGRRGVRHVRQAIEAGLRGEDLIPALLQDCRAYMFMRPNLYPEPPAEERTPAFTIYRPAHNAIMPSIGNLPNELLLPILHDLPLPSLLALASTCRSLRAFILEPSFLDRVLKEAIVRGSLRWLLPLEAVVNEKQRAYDALRLWFAEDRRPGPLFKDVEANAYVGQDSTTQKRPEAVPVPSATALIASPYFPRLAFLRECWESDSMRNRRRLWGQVAQFEELWRDYRLHGWRVDRFFPSRGAEKNPNDGELNGSSS